MVAVSRDELVRADQGVVSARVFSDPELYRLELERIFTRCWLFVAHESEVREVGQFVTRAMGEDPVIVIRGRDGNVRVLLNVCRHRGRKVCGADAGRAATFRCGYHGWTYSESGELTAVPFFEAYQGKLDKSTLGLVEARVESYKGLIFATWNRDAEPLVEYLGSLPWVLDLLFARSEAVEVLGPPVRWLAEANWKLGAANFVGDGQHIITTHGFSTQLGLHSFDPKGRPIVYSVPTHNGSGAVLSSWPEGAAHAEPYLALPEEIWPEFAEHLSPAQVEALRPLLALAGNVFPNMSFLQAAGHTPQEWGGPEGQTISFLTLRQWQPKGPDRLEGWSWLLVDRNAPDWWKESSRQCYQRTFGMAGTFEQDDLANWAAITAALRGPEAQKLWLHFEMDLDCGPSPSWPGDGDGYLQKPFSDLNERLFYKHWLKLVAQE
jgi:phenylpropionate dioxygenase-like ring-hydroxylating dioxygenase large terminal subunit